MSQNLQNFAKFQKFQLENLVDFEKCCRTHIYLQKSVPIQPKTSNILPKFCQPTLSDVSAAAACRRGRLGAARGHQRPLRPGPPSGLLGEAAFTLRTPLLGGVTTDFSDEGISLKRLPRSTVFYIILISSFQSFCKLIKTLMI